MKLGSRRPVSERISLNPLVEITMVRVVAWSRIPSHSHLLSVVLQKLFTWRGRRGKNGEERLYIATRSNLEPQPIRTNHWLSTTRWDITATLSPDYVITLHRLLLCYSLKVAIYYNREMGEKRILVISRVLFLHEEVSQGERLSIEQTT